MSDVSEITSALPTQATPTAPDAPAPAPAPAGLKPNEVRLSTGVVVGLRRLSGLDSSDLEQLMPDAGFKSVEGLAQATYLRCCAAFSIATMQADNGPVEQVTPPQNGGELRMRLAEYFEGDWGLLVSTYVAVNGLTATASSDFRPTG